MCDAADWSTSWEHSGVHAKTDFYHGPLTTKKRDDTKKGPEN
jgi:hypothetical protein